MEAVQKHFFSDLSVMLGRSLRHITRSMDTIITVTLTPIAIHAAVRLYTRRRHPDQYG